MEGARPLGRAPSAATGTARPLSLTNAAGGNQAAMARTAVAMAPAVLVRGQAGIPVPEARR